MSRTDVHAPNWVKERDPAWRHYFVEDHDHSSGDCDLNAYLAGRQRKRTRCTIRWRARGRNICCGCPMCTGKEWRKMDRRQERYEGRRLARNCDSD